MIISINQPAYIPWLGYFNRIARSDLHIVLDHVQFEKNSFVNRNKILQNKRDIWLTIPIKTKNLFGDLAINKVHVDNISNWQNKHFSSIKHGYSKSIFWQDLSTSLEDIYMMRSDLMIDYINKYLEFLLDYLEITTPIFYSSNFNYKEKKSELVLEICKHYGAKKYLSGPLGRNYLNIEEFLDNGIQVEFHDYKHPIYPQKTDNFNYNLSILDLILNCGKDSKRIIIND